MEGFDYSVHYRKGSENIADFLSRQNDVAAPVVTWSKDAKCRLDYSQLNKANCSMKPKVQQKEKGTQPKQGAKANTSMDVYDLVNKDSLMKEQAKDRDVNVMLRLSRGENVRSATGRDAQDAEGLRELAGIIVKDIRDRNGEVHPKIVVPLSLQRQVVEEAHKHSHPGVFGTYEAVRQYHWFRGMKLMVKDVVRHCPVCIAIRGRPLTKEVLAPDQRPMTFGERWHVDGLQLPESLGYDHLLVAVDAATKYVVLTPSKGETAQAATSILLEISNRFGPPREVTTDRGRAFMSNQFMTACGGLNIVFKPVAVKQPQANGMVERVNRTLIQVAKAICEERKGEPYDDSMEALRKRIRLIQRMAHKNHMEAAGKQRTYHNAHAKAHRFKVGD